MDDKLKPFDLERAKAGDKVLMLFGCSGRWLPVLASCWTEEEKYKAFPVLVKPKDKTVWLCTKASNLRMAPKTRTVWYGLARSKDGRRIFPVADSSEEALREWVESRDQIIVIHSMEVPE